MIPQVGEDHIRAYLREQPYLSPDFLPARMERAAMFAPVFVFNVQWDVRWTAQFGNHRYEHFTKWHVVDGQEKPHTATRIVTDWYPSNGTDQGNCKVQVYVGNKLPDEAIKVVETIYDYSTDLSGAPVEKPYHTEASAWRSAEYRASGAIDSSIRRWKQGDEQKDWHWSGSVQKTYKLEYVPVVGFAFKHKDRSYVFWVRDDGAVKHAKLPKDPRKIAVVAGGIAAAVALEYLTAFSGGFWTFLACSGIWGGTAYAWKRLFEDRWKAQLG